jgi:hypothetical protein
MNIDLENLGRLTDLMETISAATRTDLMNTAYEYPELIERRDLFERIASTTRMTHNYLRYVVEIYDQSDPLAFLKEIDAQLVGTAPTDVLAKYRDLFDYTGD